MSKPSPGRSRARKAGHKPGRSPARSGARSCHRRELLAAALLAVGVAAACPSRPGAADRAPRLAFEVPLVELRADPGQRGSAEVRLSGALAHEVRLKVESVEDRALAVEPLAAVEGRPAALRLWFEGDRVGMRTGRIVVATGLAEPAQLILLYTLRVAGNLDVDPATPYLNLREPQSARRLSVTSRRADFQLREARIASGPFRAALEPAPSRPSPGVPSAARRYAVRITVDEDAIAGAERGYAGTLLLLSNDPVEPSKEVPIFAMGQLNRLRPDGGLEHQTP